MTISGYQVVDFSFEYIPGVVHVKPGTLVWDETDGNWTYETVTIPLQVVGGGSPVYRTPLGKKIIWADDIYRLSAGGNNYEPYDFYNYAPLMYLPRPRPKPGQPPYPQPEIDPEWENPPAPTETRTVATRLVIASATAQAQV